MSVLVTGASGFVGSRLVARLLNDFDDEVIAFGRSRYQPGHKRLRSVEAAFDTFDSWSDLVKDATAVYHLGWTSLPSTASASPSVDASANVLGTLRLLDALRSRPGCRLVFASSGGTVYGEVQSLPIDEQHATRPMSAYGVSKLAVEGYLRFYHVSHGLRPVTLRISNIYGEGQDFGRNFGVIGTFAGSMIKGDAISIYGDGSTVRDYVHVKDVVRSFIAAAHCRHDIETCNIGSGEGRSLNEIIAAIRSVLQAEPTVHYLPGRAFDVPTSVLDIRRARAQLDWQPDVSFGRGLAGTVLALRTQIMKGVGA